MMRMYVRAALATLLAATLIAVGAPAALAAFGVTEPHFEAGTCNTRGCEYSSPKGQFFTQAAGHPAWGITTVELNSKGVGLGREPEGSLKRLRVDVPPGLAANPEALPKCSPAAFKADTCPANTKVGETELTVFLAALDTTISGTVYNLEPAAGLPLEFGIHVQVPAVANEHIFLEGHVDWSGDYHEYFEINEISKSIPIVKSKLLFEGNAGQGNFLTLPSVCAPSTTSFVEVESYAGEISRTQTHTPVGVEKCDKVPFSPTTSVSGDTSASDQPDGATTVVAVPQKVAAGDINTSDIKDAHVTLPAGMTLNAPAARGLATCTAGQIGIGTARPVECPAASQLGTVTIETDLPPNSLKGAVYLGGPDAGPITDPPFTIYLDAEGSDAGNPLGVSVRLRGTVTPDPVTGRLEVTFADNPQLPFGELRLTLNGGPRAPLANPLTCDPTTTDSAFTPYTGGATAFSSTPFQASGCPSPIPFTLGQSTQDSSKNAGAYTGYTLNFTRGDGNQYLGALTSVLPAGLVGEIPSVTLCGEQLAQQGNCPAASQIGTATAEVGAGSEPYPFVGPVFLTGPYGGAPYGLSVPIEAAAGPFDLGRVLTRATINVDPHTGRVIASASLPTIFKGVPLRLKNLSVVVNRPKFLTNPTNCGTLSTDSLLTSTMNGTQGIGTPFAVANCSALAFKPGFAVSTSANTSKAIGAGLQVNLTQAAHESNIKSVQVQLPTQLPSRLTTLQKACPEAAYAANPYSCPSSSKVGSATVTTPVLPGKLTGPAYLVSHGGAAFPDLDLLLEGSGVRVILVGNTAIRQGVTTSTFASIPDVPVSSFLLDLPTGPNSALASNGTFCNQTLVMPTTITGQSGAVVKQNTNVAVAGCTGGKGRARIRILSHKVSHHKLVLRIQTFAAGRVSVRARNLRLIYKRVAKPAKVTIKVPLSRSGKRALAAHRKIKFKVRVGFLPKAKVESISVASTRVKFKR
jgi:hypothetical protein